MNKLDTQIKIKENIAINPLSNCKERKKMLRTILPTSKDHWLSLRNPNLNSTEIPALFGLSPYCTIYELWHRKKGNYSVAFQETERTSWGLALQDAVAAKVAKDNGWNIRRMDEYIYDDELRYGSSFDFAIDENGIAEIKTVDSLVFHNDWSETEAPLHIELQCQMQLLVSGREFVFITCLSGGNRLVLIKRTPDTKVFNAIKTKVSEFWKSIEEGNEPKPNMEVDAGFIASLYGYAEPSKVIHIEDPAIKTLALKYKEAGDRIKVDESTREAVKAQMLMSIGDAEKALGDGFSISAGTVGPTQISYLRQGYRQFKISFKKEKT